MMNAGIAFGTSLLSVLAVGSVSFAVTAGSFGLLAMLLSLALVMRPWQARNSEKEVTA
jgi:hypothetical protein